MPWRVGWVPTESISTSNVTIGLFFLFIILNLFGHLLLESFYFDRWTRVDIVLQIEFYSHEVSATVFPQLHKAKRFAASNAISAYAEVYRQKIAVRQPVADEVQEGRLINPIRQHVVCTYCFGLLGHHQRLVVSPRIFERRPAYWQKFGSCSIPTIPDNSLLVI